MSGAAFDEEDFSVLFHDVGGDFLKTVWAEGGCFLEPVHFSLPIPLGNTDEHGFGGMSTDITNSFPLISVRSIAE